MTGRILRGTAIAAAVLAALAMIVYAVAVASGAA